MKLWTIQHSHVVESLKSRYVASWDFTEVNFRPSYKWMIHFLAAHTGIEAVPIWCWHSCDGKLLSPPTVATASALIGDWEYNAHQMRVIEIVVPDSLPLLSSYCRWNGLLYEALEFKKTPDIHSNRHLKMFKEPLIKHEGDDIQAVLPYIESEWVLDIRPLPETDESWENAI